MNVLFLILAFLMTFFMVGFVLIELFFSKIIFRIKFPLYIISSLVFSTYLIYLIGLIFGLNRQVVILSFLPFFPVSIILFYKLKHEFVNYFKSNTALFMLLFFVVMAYFLALNPGILGRKDDYLVMSSVNWQDTALHLSITQSLTQGNFPPQAPYFSGVPLSYYFFSDLHSAIIAIIYGRFFPRVFVYDNALLAGVLAMTVYALAFEVSKSKKLSLISAFIGSFYGSFIFFEFFRDIFNGAKVIPLLTNNTYSMEYRELFGMANMADYYMQNRPMMIGLPVIVIVITLVLYAFRQKNLWFLFLAGIIGASLVKFQFFCVLAGAIYFFVIALRFFKKGNYKFILISLFLFLIPIPVFYLVFGTKSVNGLSFFDLVKNTFHFGPWDNGVHPFLWYLYFFPMNLGLPFLITLFSLFIKSKTKFNKLLSILAVLFVAIPCLMTFTIAEGDMLKFFYFAAVIFSVITPIILDNVIKNKIIFNIFMVIIIFTSTFASVLTLGNSYFNKNLGYSLADYNVGVWIRNYTPQKSVFVTTTSIHSPASDFGGRLRVISYINWPYSHGYNIGDDNVFTRASDVENVFKTGDIDKVKLKYKANYLFYGGSESSQFPNAWKLFDSNGDLKLIYDQDNIKIYEIL